MGSAVDTIPPDLVILSPESASIIRDSFTIKGNWTDDRGVQTAYCTLTNTDDILKKYVVYGNVTTSFAGQGSWDIRIEKGTVPDGSYEAAVSIVDIAGHETKAIRQIVIDNTAPVIILKRPSSRKGADASSTDGYGQLFTIKGLAADDSGVGLIEVNIYSDEELTQLVKTVSIKNVPNTISLDVAEFIEGVENDYSAIYGSTARTAGEQKRWCRVIAYDGSQCYPADGSAQSEEDQKGNAATGYYLYEDLSSSVLSQYKITELYAMENGSYTGERTASNSVLDILAQNKIDVGVFTLNPANNPYYTISGYSELKLDGTDFGESMYVKNGNSLVISVKPGLDSYELVEDSLTVSLRQCNRNGEPVGDVIPLENITKEKSGNTYTIAAPVNKGNGINIGKTYLVIVEGNDIKGNSVKTKGNGYGFYLDSNGVKPTLKVTEPGSSATQLVNNSSTSVHLEGTVYFPSESCEGGTVLIRDSESDLEWIAGTFMDERDANGNLTGTQYTDTEQPWNITLNLKKDLSNATYLPDGNHTLYVYAITGTDFANAANVVVVERNFKVDTNIPEAPEVTKIANRNYANTEWYNELNLRVDLNVEDKQRHSYSSGLLKTEYTVGNNGIWTALSSTSYGYINGLEEGANTVKFKSVDTVQNESDPDDASFTVNVDTIAPALSKVSIGDTTDWKDFTAGSLLNIDSSTHKKIRIEITEANVLQNVIVTVGGTSLPGAFEYDTGISKWVWQSTAEATTIANNTETQVTITAFDAAGNSVPVTTHRVLIDTEGPVIDITTPAAVTEGEPEAVISEDTNLRAGIRDEYGTVAETKYLLKKNSPLISASETEADIIDSAQDENAASTGWKTPAGPGSVEIATTAAKTSSVTGDNTENIQKGHWYLYVYSKDEAGNPSAVCRTFWLDKDDPDLRLTTEPGDTYKKETTQTISIAGKVKDSNGIAHLYFLKNADATTEDITLPATPENGYYNWTFTKNYGASTDLTDRDYNFIIRAIDKAGKTTDYTKTVRIDTTEPEVTGVSSTDNWYTSTVVDDIVVTASDVTSGIGLVQYSTNNGTTWTPLTYTAASGTATGPVIFEESGENKTLKIKVSDTSGNSTEVSVTRNIDAVLPTVSGNYILIAGGTTGDFAGTVYVNGTADVTVWGNLEDSESGAADSIRFVIQPDTQGAQPVTLSGITPEYSTDALPASRTETMPSFTSYNSITDKKTIKAWKATIPGDSLDSGSLKVYGKDIAGNQTYAMQSIKLVVDSTAPEAPGSISITDTSDSTTRAYSAGSNVYWVNNTKTFTINGISADASGTNIVSSGIAVTKLVISSSNTFPEGTSTHTAYTTSNPMNWSFAVDDLNTFGTGVNEVYAKITSVDLAGNTGTPVVLTIKFDTTAPAKNGNVQLKRNDTYEDYSSATDRWYRSSALEIKGNLTETQSGLSKVYYKLASATSSTLASTFFGNYNNPTNRNGVIDCSTTGFEGKITNLTDGDNYVVLVAEDNAGNPALIDSDPYHLKIDTSAPSINTSSGGTQYTNGTQPVTVNGTYSETGSGIKDIEVYVVIGSETKSKTLTLANGGLTSAGTWSATFTAADLRNTQGDQSYTIKATATDNAGNTAPITVAKLLCDKQKPVPAFGSISPSVSAAANSCYIKPAVELTVRGSTSDNSTEVHTWLKLVSYKDDGTHDAGQPVYESTDTQHAGTTSRSWALTIPADTLTTTGGYTKAKLYACANDKAGNTAETELYTLIFDETGPVFKSSPDASTDTGFTAETVNNVSYNADNWYNNQNLMVTGTWQDAAGVSEVYYEIVKPGQSSTITQANAATSSYDSFTLSKTNDAKAWYSYNAEIRGFDPGENTLIMYAKDALGNVSTSSWSGTIKVDITPPSATAYTSNGITYSLSEIHLTNGQEKYEADGTTVKPIKLYFVAADETGGSGIKTDAPLTIKLGEANAPAAKCRASYGTGNLVTVELDESTFAGSTANYIPVVVTITDIAGNTSPINVGTINVDTTPPQVNLKGPKDASDEDGIQVNGIIDIQGSASDKNLKSAPLTKLMYKKASETTWTTIDLTDSSNIGNTKFVKQLTNTDSFNLKLNTTKLIDKTAYNVQVLVEDGAGNEATSNQIDFTVDQDTDRPVISFMDIEVPDIPASSSSTDEKLKLTTKSLRITVSDDDEVDSVVVKVAGTIIAPDTGYPKNDTWLYTLTQNDGTYPIEFIVTDKENTSFTSGGSLAPKFTDGEHKIEKNGVSLQLMLDNTPPVVKGRPEFVYYTTTYPDTPSWSETVPALGGSRNKLALRIKAADENKIAGITAKITVSDTQTITKAGVIQTNAANATGHTQGVSAQSEDPNKYYSTWIIQDIDITSLNDGNYKLELTIKDNAGSSKNDIISLNIDRTAPTITLISPQQSQAVPATYSSGSIIVNGSISGASTLKYAISPDGAHAPNGTEVANWESAAGVSSVCSEPKTLNPTYSDEIPFGANWSINLDGEITSTTGVHTYLLNEYLVKYGITTSEKLNTTNLSQLFTEPVILYLWLKAEDEVGNIREEPPFPIYVNPQGDRPTIQFNSPSANAVTLAKAVSIYGTHTDTKGTSAENIGVKAVFVQLISKAHGNTDTSLTGRLTYTDTASEKTVGSFTMAKTDLDWMAANGYEVYNMVTYDYTSANNPKWGTDITDKQSGYNYSDYGALARVAGATWNMTINSSNELNPNNDSIDGKNPVGIQVFAKDGDGKLSTIKVQRFVYFDSDTPQIEDLQLVQYDGTGTADSNIIATRTYTPDMYINGSNWVLKGKATDTESITELKINNTDVTGITLPVNAEGENPASVDFIHNLSTSGDAGTIELTVKAKDNANHTGEEVISIRYDNTAPVLVTSGTDFRISKDIKQSDGFYKFSSVAKEDPIENGAVTTPQSGFAYTAFYFKRGNKLYDVLNSKANSTITTTETQLSALHSEDNMYWYTKTLKARTTAGSTLEIDATDTTGVSGIRTNSLVKIGGAFYKVLSVDTVNKSFTVDGIPPKEKTIAYVAIAGLIDNIQKETAEDNAVIQADGYYLTSGVEYEDGDRMLEFVDKSGSSAWTWTGYVCSKNIPDGPVELHYIVFDVAGNYSHQSVNGIICNNSPRLAGFLVETDYNNDGILNAKDGKLETYLASAISASSKTSASGEPDAYDPDGENAQHVKVPLDNSIIAGSAAAPEMTVRGKTVITPEIVGGNGKVKYKYTVTDKAGSNPTITGSNATELYTGEGATDNYSYAVHSTPINIQLGDLVNFKDTSCAEFKFTFYDETECRDDILESVDYTDTQKNRLNAYLTIYMGIAASATTQPVVKIDPFHWNGLTDNSIYGSGASTKSYANLKGHIELEDDWTMVKTAATDTEPAVYYSSFDGTTNGGSILDSDPKVSGQIVVRGSVHDNNLIKELKINYADATTAFIEDKTVATFTNGALTPASDVAQTSYETNGYWFKIKEETFTASGHDVTWELYLNTAVVCTSVATKDAALTMTAYNFGTPARVTGGSNAAYKSIDGTTIYQPITASQYSNPKYNTPGTVQTTKSAKKAYYRMDIVPYITAVTTKLSASSTDYPTIYSRTALGHYPVYAIKGADANSAEMESIAISGFNLSGGTVNFAGVAADNNPSVGSSTTTDAKSGATIYSNIAIPTAAVSGNITISVSGISSLNNDNNDNSRGDYGYTYAEDGTRTDSVGTIAAEGVYKTYNNYYNRIPNNKNNNTLTDNVCIDIWDFNSQAALAVNNGKVDNLEMKINPKTGMLGFVFSNGTVRLSIPNGITNSYQYWDLGFDYISHNALCYDKNGYAYAVAVGGDISAANDRSCDVMDLYSSQWGHVWSPGANDPNGQYSHSKQTNHMRKLDQIGQKGDKNDQGDDISVDKDRLQSQSLITHTNNDDASKTDIYLAYYDMINEEIRFKAGTLDAPSATTASDFGNFVNREAGAQLYSHSANYCQIIADNTDATFGKAGSSVALGVTSNNVVVIVWFDGKKLHYAYNETPLAKATTNTAPIRVNTANNGTGWVDCSTYFANYTNIGQDCQIAVGSDKSIHIAAYDKTKENLVYIYMATYNSTPVVSVVDAYGTVGSKITIDVAKVGSYQIPYIGYYGSFPGKPRQAYLANPAKFFGDVPNEEAVVNGSEGNYYTGIWECSIVPTKDNNVKVERKINIGVWKHKKDASGNLINAGELAYSTYGDGFGTETGDVKYYDSSAAGGTKADPQDGVGNCYGNGSNNAVLAYVIEISGSQYNAETAQKRR